MGLEHFEQFGTGSYFEPFSAAPAQEIQIPQNSPITESGGTAKLMKP
jgi:monoamine oxidase